MEPEEITRALKEKKELLSTIGEQEGSLILRSKSLSEEMENAESAVQTAADGVLLGTVEAKARDKARERRDAISRERRNTTEDLDAAQRIKPKLAAEVSRLEQQLGESVKAKARKRLEELSREAAARVADLAPEFAALAHALEAQSDVGFAISHNLPPISKADSLEGWRKLRTKWLAGG